MGLKGNEFLPSILGADVDCFLKLPSLQITAADISIIELEFHRNNKCDTSLSLKPLIDAKWKESPPKECLHPRPNDIQMSFENIIYMNLVQIDIGCFESLQTLEDQKECEATQTFSTESKMCLRERPDSFGGTGRPRKRLG